MRTLNLGILAHVDAGKTSLTERLLYAAGVIDEVGSVDDGTTRADTLTLERQRGITIKSAVVSFVIDDVTVNLIDTPGHPDFIAEVERVLSVLDGAVLVVSAVEGVQAQTRVLMRALQRLRVPTLVFVNKIDRGGAEDERVVDDLVDKLGLAPIAMGYASQLGTRQARFVPYGENDADFQARLVDRLSDADDLFLASYLDGQLTMPYRRLIHELAAQTGRALVQPVYIGSATTGAGVRSLMTGLAGLLPGVEANAGGAVSGTVFKVERGEAGERIAYVRMFSGTLRTRARVNLEGDDRRRITAISVFDRGGDVPRGSLAGGQIGKVWGLGEVRIGDSIGSPPQAYAGYRFAPPTLETVIVPRTGADRSVLHVALTQLAEQDPLINLRQGGQMEETVVSLYGEVQKEVIRDTLAEDFAVEVDFLDTTTICVERPVGPGTAVELLPSERTPERPYLAGVGLRIEPAAPGTGITVRLGIERGSLIRAFLKAIEETIPLALRAGRYGWKVVDCTVTIVSSGYAARQSHAHGHFDRAMSSTADDFRAVTALVLAQALGRAGTVVCEPIHRFHLEVPDDALGPVLSVLPLHKAMPEAPEPHGSSYRLDGEIPAAEVQGLQEKLIALTRGEGVLESGFDRYDPVHGTPPARPRPVTRMSE